MPNLAAAIRLASKDPEFAKDLVKNPNKYKDAFKLTPKQIGSLSKISLSKIIGKVGSAAKYDA